MRRRGGGARTRFHFVTTWGFVLTHGISMTIIKCPLHMCGTPRLESSMSKNLGSQAAERNQRTPKDQTPVRTQASHGCRHLLKQGPTPSLPTPGTRVLSEATACNHHELLGRGTVIWDFCDGAGSQVTRGAPAEEGTVLCHLGPGWLKPWAAVLSQRFLSWRKKG